MNLTHLTFRLLQLLTVAAVTCSLKLSFNARSSWQLRSMATNQEGSTGGLNQKLTSSRRFALKSAVVAAIQLSLCNGAFADGSKEEKSFENCLSKCVFNETRPPPIGSSNERLEVTKSRGEIVRECKQKCAKNKDQLLLGKPKKKIASTTQ